MTRRPRPPHAALLLPLLLLAAGCGDGGDHGFQGYVEGQYLRMAAPEGGWLVDLAVAEGDRVVPGQPLFALEDTQQQAALAEAKGRLAQAVAQLADLRLGLRPEEIARIEARLRQAEALATYTAAELRRQQDLASRDVAARARLDLARSDARQAEAEVAAVKAELATARLPARSDVIQAAEAAMEAARAAVAQAEWRLAQRRVTAPAAALVDDTVRRPGEWVPAGGPVVTLLPPEQVKLVFFVPEPQRALLYPGDTVALSCTGCPDGLTARVSFVAPEAEYTPPVIYSLETRAKLVFRIEAEPQGSARNLLPGQPVTVQRAAAGVAGRIGIVDLVLRAIVRAGSLAGGAP